MVGGVVGKTVTAQVRQAARHLGYAVDDLRERFGGAAIGTEEPSTLAQRVAALRRMLTELDRQVAGPEAEVAVDSQGGQP